MKDCTIITLPDIPDDIINTAPRVILAVDPAEDDAARERSITALKALKAAVPSVILVKGIMKRLEDVKKYLYAGGTYIVMENVPDDLYAEAAARFGAERLLRHAEDYETPVPAFSWADLKTGENGLIPVVVQDVGTNAVLMVAWQNEEAFNATIRTGIMTYWSRSRGELWVKGETSGNYQYLRSLKIDCDNDTLLAQVLPAGPACHTGHYSCFYRDVVPDEFRERGISDVLNEVYSVIEDRKHHPKEGSYTNYLFDKGTDKICKKIGEEATEVVIAAKNDAKEEMVYEVSDLLYHTMVMMAKMGVTWEDIAKELAERG